MYNGLPLIDRTAGRGARRPDPAAGRAAARPLHLLPGRAEVPRRRPSTSATAATRIAVEVDIDSEDAAGVLFSHGARFGGHSLYVKDRKLKYVYNFVGDNEQMIESTEGGPDRAASSSARRSCARATRMPTTGTLTLFIDDEKVGEGTDHDPARQLLARRRGPERRARTRASRSPTTTPATRPYAFTGGTIKEAIVDVSGEPLRRPRDGGRRDDGSRVTGSSPVIRVPCPGLVSILSVPPSAAVRSARFVSPQPVSRRANVEADPVVLDDERHVAVCLAQPDRDGGSWPRVLGGVLQTLDAAEVRRRLERLGVARQPCNLERPA